MNTTTMPLRHWIDPRRPITYGIVQAGEHVADGVPYIRPVDMTDASGVSNPSNLQRTSPEIARSYSRSTVRPGDLVFSIGPSFGKVMLVPEILDGANLTQGTARLAPGDRIDGRWLFWTLQSKVAVEFWESSIGGATFRALNLGPLGETPIAAPPRDDQRRIAAFLDDQVARIDQVIELRERQMQTARERRWELFTSRVRDVPSQTLPLRRVLSFVTDGPFGSAFSSDDYVEDGYPVVRLGNIGFAQFRDTDLAKIPKEILDRFPRCRVSTGDLLVAALGDDRNHAGRACTAPASIVPAMVKGKCFCVRTVPNLASSRFLSILLSSPLGAQTFSVVGRGSTRNMINIEILKESVWDLPELADQILIAEQFERESANAWHLESAFVSAVKLLQERKRSLITAAVTGEFDVNSASTRGLVGVTS